MICLNYEGIEQIAAASAKSLGAGKYHDGGGLYLVKTRPENGKWVLRLTIFGRRREMGLGPFPEIRLADAGRSTTEARYLVRQGRDPIGERQTEYKTSRHLLQDIASDAFEARKDEGKAGRWMSPLEIHMLPKLGKTPVAKITQNDTATTLKPLWHTKASTATKARALLGKSRHKVENIPAMP